MDSEKLFVKSYCYGPVDLIEIRKGDSTMWLTLCDTVGRKAQAVYQGCVYWRLDTKQKGMHLSIVRKVDANELICRGNSITMRALRKNTRNIGRLLKEWEEEGLNFYLHLGTRPDEEFLVVARELHYREDDAE